MSPCISQNHQTNLYLKMELIKILEIDEVEQKFTTQFDLHLYWNDFRIQYQNLKKEIDINLLTREEKNSIWMPTLVFRNVLLNYYTDILFEFNLKFWNTASIGIPVGSLYYMVYGSQTSNWSNQEKSRME